MEKLFKIGLSDEESQRLKEKANAFGLKSEELVTYMISDLICGEKTLGSDERDIMNMWYERAIPNFGGYHPYTKEDFELEVEEYVDKLKQQYKEDNILPDVMIDEMIEHDIIDDLLEGDVDYYTLRYNNHPDKLQAFHYFIEKSFKINVEGIFKELYAKDELTDADIKLCLEYLYR